MPRLRLRQFTKPSFHTFVLANLTANQTGSIPVLYRLAGAERVGTIRQMPTSDQKLPGLVGAETGLHGRATRMMSRRAGPRVHTLEGG